VPNLSTPIGELRARYDVVVIGSGYGGAVVARWMAKEAQERRARNETSFSVCLLERGLEIRPGQYPTSLMGTLRAGQADTRYGHIGRRTSLFDVRMNRDLTVLVGCGLGGTSLINASVILEPKLNDLPSDLRSCWPQELRTPGELSDEFASVKKALGAEILPADVVLDKMTHLIESAKLNRKPKRKDHSPPIAVSFHTHVNEFGVQQERCTLCGNCITGCNYSAKNTLIMNYLPAAAAAGASIFCGVQVSAVEPADPEGGDWLVHARLLDRAASAFGNPDMPIRAGMVFLASGTLGSTEILLRSRERYGLSLSPALGQHFSGNGDVIAFGYNTDSRVNGMAFGPRLPTDPTVGPTIAGMLDERDLPSGAMIQEGAVPGALGFPLRFLGPLIARVSRLGVSTRADFSIKSLWREVDSLLRGSHHGSLVRTQTFLGMSYDDGQGQMGLAGDRLRITWDDAGNQPVFTNIARRLAELTGNMKGAYVVNPIWSRMFGRRLVIAHPLGGCAMSDSPDTGVVNSSGQVYRAAKESEHDPSRAAEVYRGLYVCDGAIIPTPLGTNPSLTIAALAQRIVERARQTIPSRPIGPDDIDSAQPRVSRTDSTIVGLRYAERLKGSMRLDGCDTRVELFLHLSIEDLEKHDSDPKHNVQVVGIARAADLAEGFREFTISDGVLHVMIDDNRCVDTKLLVYQLKLTPVGNQKNDATRSALWLRGYKRINFDTCKRSTWKAATRLPFVIYQAFHDDQPGPEFDASLDMIDFGACASDRERFLGDKTTRNAGILGVGLAGGSVADVIRLAASMHVINEPRFLRRVLLAFRFQWRFVDALIQARVWALRRTEAIDPLNRNVNSRPPADSGKVILDRRTDGPKRYMLTRFDGRGRAGPDGLEDRPPVILIPGFSMSTYWFRANTPGTNITEFLYNRGYDVWLLDYRASDRLKASAGQFTLDDLASSDFPDAIRQVFRETGRRVQIIAHCVGSLSVLMSLLSGRLADRGVHSLILSQAFAFIDQPFVNRLKAKLHLAEVLRFFGFHPILTPDFDLRSSLAVRLLDRLLYFYPSRERCKSGVCRRLLLIYGEANRHAQLDRATHEKIYDMVDRGNLTTLAQLQKMAVQRHIVDANGTNAYLRPENGKNVDVPITLLQGERNNLFRRSGAHKTLAWLRKNGSGSAEEKQKRFTLTEVPDYGHMDVFIGKNSARDVYPKILEALESMRR
jgi:cholesterol oxidase